MLWQPPGPRLQQGAAANSWLAILGLQVFAEAG